MQFPSRRQAWHKPDSRILGRFRGPIRRGLPVPKSGRPTDRGALGGGFGASEATGLGEGRGGGVHQIASLGFLNTISLMSEKKESKLYSVIGASPGWEHWDRSSKQL